jgi:amino acid transporter
VKTVKGVELPINILVVVAIAVIVLLGLVALYFVGFNPFSVTTALEATKNSGCREYMNRQTCNSWDFSFTYSGNVTIATFHEFMNQYYYCNDDEACARRACSCPGY